MPPLSQWWQLAVQECVTSNETARGRSVQKLHVPRVIIRAARTNGIVGTIYSQSARGTFAPVLARPRNTTLDDPAERWTARILPTARGEQVPGKAPARPYSVPRWLYRPPDKKVSLPSLVRGGNVKPANGEKSRSKCAFGQPSGSQTPHGPPAESQTRDGLRPAAILTYALPHRLL